MSAQQNVDQDSCELFSASQWASPAETQTLQFLNLTREQFLRSQQFASVNNATVGEGNNIGWLPSRLEQPFIAGKKDRFGEPLFRQLSLFEINTHNLQIPVSERIALSFEEDLMKKCSELNNFNKPVRTPTKLGCRVLYQNVANFTALNQVNRNLVEHLRTMFPDLVQEDLFEDWWRIFQENQRNIAQCFFELNRAIRHTSKAPSEFTFELKDFLAHNRYHTIPSKRKNATETASISDVKRRKNIVAFNEQDSFTNYSRKRTINKTNFGNFPSHKKRQFQKRSKFNTTNNRFQGRTNNFNKGNNFKGNRYSRNQNSNKSFQNKNNSFKGNKGNRFPRQS